MSVKNDQYKYFFFFLEKMQFFTFNFFKWSKNCVRKAKKILLITHPKVFLISFNLSRRTPLCHNLAILYAVSYTHLDVYKRQPSMT